MSRRLEMGRAVLASSQQNIELWLTTLITISSPQLSINLEQFSSRYLLTLLSSGQVWIGRSDNTRIEISLTLRGEPFPCFEFQDVLQSLLQAPVWSQLKLRLAVSEDVVPRNGFAYINITDSSNDEPLTKRRCHRLLENVSYTDLQPPEDFPRAQLQVVRFSMDILDTRQRSQFKRSNTSQDHDRAHVQQDENGLIEESGDDMLLHEPSLADHDVAAENAIDQSLLSSRRNKRKRDSLRDKGNHGQEESPPTLPLVMKRRQCGSSAARSVMSPTRSTQPSKEELAKIVILVERAMHLSITGTSKSSSHAKIKANTFSEGLSDIAPVLWRPGYLVALAERARLIPTIGRSLGSTVAARAISTSLRDKLKRLGPEHKDGICGDLPWQCSPTDSGSEVLKGLVIERTWLHLQTSLTARVTPPLQAFTNIDADAADSFDPYEILEPSNTHRATDNDLPYFENEKNLSIKSSKQDELFHDFTRPISVGHDAADMRTRSGATFETNPSSAAGGCHDKGSSSHHASSTAQLRSQDDHYIRHSTCDGANRIGNSECMSLAAGHEEQSATIVAKAGQSRAPVDDLLFED